MIWYLNHLNNQRGVLNDRRVSKQAALRELAKQAVAFISDIPPNVVLS
jgi:hypothetical protein